MKKLLLFSALFITFLTFAQVPQGISYQAIALNGSGAPVVSSNVRVKLSILDTSASGTVLYSETHLKTTNAQGLFNLTIGQGTVVSGTFAAINWGINSKFLKVEMDASGGTNYILVGTTELLSVPYALAAGSLAGSSANDSIIENKSSNFGFVDYFDNKVYVYNSSTAAWSSQVYNSNSSPTLLGANGNFSFIDNFGSKVYFYSGKTATWSSQAFNANSSPTAIGSNGNFGFVDDFGSKVYVYNGKTGTLSSQAFDPNSSPDLLETNGSFGFIDSFGAKAYAYSSKTGTWSSQVFDGSSSPTLTTSNGNIGFIDSFGSKTYIYNSKTGTWSSQSFNGNSSPSIITSETN
jgi:hypothetical protein